MTAPMHIRELRFRRNVECLHRLGSRAVHALLSELAASHLLRTEIEMIGARYVARLDPVTMRAVGAERAPASTAAPASYVVASAAR